MSHRELLEDAAKAAGIDLWHEDVFTNGLTQKVSANGILCWNPITNDGDALRLAVKLRLLCGFVQPNCWAELPGQYPSYEPYEPDPYAATRRAIVRAAAEIGRSMV